MHVGNDALEIVSPSVLAAFGVHIVKLNTLAFAAVQYDVTNTLRQGLERRFYVERIVFGQRLDQLKIIRIMPIPAAHRAAGERKVRVRHDALGIEESAHAKPVTIRARAGRTIERE